MSVRATSVSIDRKTLLRLLNEAKAVYVKGQQEREARRYGMTLVEAKKQETVLRRKAVAEAKKFLANTLSAKELRSALYDLQSAEGTVAYLSEEKKVNTGRYDEAISLIKLSCDEKFRVSARSQFGELIGL
jgi:hypothetical protein